MLIQRVELHVVTPPITLADVDYEPFLPSISLIFIISVRNGFTYEDILTFSL